MSFDSTGAPAGAGAPATPAPQASPAPSSTPTAVPAEPSVIDLTPDSLVRIPGQDKPVKYGDYYRGFQSQFTKKAQEASQLQQRYQQLEQQFQQAQERLRQIEAQHRAQVAAQPGNDLLAEIRQLPYLDGQSAGRVLEHIAQQQAQSAAALEQRDHALMLITQQLVETKKQLQRLAARAGQTDFEGKIKKFASDLNLPAGTEDFVKELYLAYEGDDLDNEFPTILQNRWNQLQNVIQEMQRRKVQEARQAPFVPGRGGIGSASRPIANLATAKPSEIADALWAGMVDGGVET